MIKAHLPYRATSTNNMSTASITCFGKWGRMCCSFCGPKKMQDSDEEPKNWKGIVIAVAVILFIVAMVILAIALVTPDLFKAHEKYKPGEPFTFDMLNDDDLDADIPPVYTMLPDGNGYIVKNVNDTHESVDLIELNESGDVIKRESIITGQLQLHGAVNDINKILLSPNKHLILVCKSDKKCLLLNINTQQPVHDGHFGNKPVEKIKFLTNGSLVYVQDNKVLIKRPAEGTAVSLTDSINEKDLQIGVADHFNKEILGCDDLLLESPDGRALMVGAVSSRPLTDTMRYKRTISERSKLTLYISSLSPSTPPIKLQLHREEYITGMTWMDNSHIFISSVSYDDKSAKYYICTTSNGNCQPKYEYTNEDLKYVGRYGNVMFNSNNTAFYIILPDPANRKFRYRHLAKITIDELSRSSPSIHFLTTYDWSDLQLLATYSDWLIYLTTGSTSSHQQLYGIHPISSRPVCLSCRIKFDVICDYLSVDSLSPDKTSNIKISCLGPDVPSHYIVDIQPLLNNDTQTTEAVMIMPDIQYNKIKKKLSGVKPAAIQFINVPLGDGLNAIVKLHSPSKLSVRQKYLYGLIIIISEEPEGHIAVSRYPPSFYTYLANNQSYIVAELDIRGSSGHGETLRQANYGGLGQREAKDIETIIRYFRDHNDEYKMNLSQIAVIGEAYGGLVTLHTVRQQVVHCGIAIAPVSTLKIPEPYNLRRYSDEEESSELNYCIKQSKDCQSPARQNILLIHGTADDVINYKHALKLMRTLQLSGVEGFKQQIYPDIGHNLFKSSITKHLYKYITNHLKECFTRSYVHLSTYDT